MGKIGVLIPLFRDQQKESGTVLPAGVYDSPNGTQAARHQSCARSKAGEKKESRCEERLLS
jgi:hypothetical protein